MVSTPSNNLSVSLSSSFTKLEYTVCNPYKRVRRPSKQAKDQEQPKQQQQQQQQQKEIIVSRQPFVSSPRSTASISEAAVVSLMPPQNAVPSANILLSIQQQEQQQRQRRQHHVRFVDDDQAENGNESMSAKVNTTIHPIEPHNDDDYTHLFHSRKELKAFRKSAKSAASQFAREAQGLLHVRRLQEFHAAATAGNGMAHSSPTVAATKPKDRSIDDHVNEEAKIHDLVQESIAFVSAATTCISSSKNSEEEQEEYKADKNEEEKDEEDVSGLIYQLLPNVAVLRRRTIKTLLRYREVLNKKKEFYSADVIAEKVAIMSQKQTAHAQEMAHRFAQCDAAQVLQQSRGNEDHGHDINGSKYVEPETDSRASI